MLNKIGNETIALTTTDQALTEAFIALLTEFGKFEGAPLRAYMASKETSDNTEMAEIMKGLVEIADFETDNLVASRLAANNRKVPLLQAGDVDRVITSVFDDDSMGEGAAMMRILLKPIVLRLIEGNLIFLNGINSDPYAAFWVFAAALTNEAASSGRTLKQVVASSESRTNIYRTCMTYQSWRKQTTVMCAMMVGISSSEMFGGMGALLPDADAAQLNEQLTALEEENSSQLAELMKWYKQSRTTRAQEIWPASNRR
jgi:hypothetical protein